MGKLNSNNIFLKLTRIYFDSFFGGDRKSISKIFLLQVIKEGKVITGDLGGSAKCSEFTEEIIRKIEQS